MKMYRMPARGQPSACSAGAARTVDERDVKVPRGDDGLGKAEDEGADKRHLGDVLDAHVFRVLLAAAFQGRVACQPA
jgi:hypothetical protein